MALYRKYQGNRMSMVFQEPMTSLNPTQRVGNQVDEVLRLHTDLKPEERKEKGIESLPGTLESAVNAMERDSLVRETLGDALFESYIAAKKSEWDEYRTQVTRWELDKYLGKF